MPTHEEIRQHSRELADRIGYEFEDEREDSRVTLLTHPDAERRIPKAADEELDPIEFSNEVEAGLGESEASGGCGTACGCM